MISIDNFKKEPLPKRIKYAINRFRNNIQLRGWKNAMLPLIRRLFLLILLLIFSVIGYHYFPKNYYIQQLQNQENRMSQNGLTIIPNLIKNLLNNISIVD
jgi:hypothetical protein